jgi:hypothetical protein
LTVGFVCSTLHASLGGLTSVTAPLAIAIRRQLPPGHLARAKDGVVVRVELIYDAEALRRAMAQAGG